MQHNRMIKCADSNLLTASLCKVYSECSRTDISDSKVIQNLTLKQLPDGIKLV